MGGSDGGGFGYRDASGSRDLEILGVDDAAVAAFQTQLSGLLGELLANYNERDHALVSKRLEPIVEALCDEYSGSMDRLFGGSVAKHTYVDGLSDIDCLITIDDGDLGTGGPQAALERMAEVARDVSPDANVKIGRMAVTLTFADGMEIQLLPAVRAEDGRVHVPSPSGEGWSKIDPQTFREALTQRNLECGGKLVPTIKLAKAILATLDDDGGMLSGYHVESLAIEAFRNYQGTRTTAAMLPAFFERARTLVLEPIRDSTGQSVHVDSDLGDPNSELRQEISFVLGRVARQMRTASAAGSLDRWRDFFGLED